MRLDNLNFLIQEGNFTNYEHYTAERDLKIPDTFENGPYPCVRHKVCGFWLPRYSFLLANENLDATKEVAGQLFQTSFLPDFLKPFRTRFTELTGRIIQELGLLAVAVTREAATSDVQPARRPKPAQAEKPRRKARRRKRQATPKLSQGYFSPSQLANRHNVPLDALRKRLRRFCKKTASGWEEVENPKARSARIIYSERAVAHILQDLKKIVSQAGQYPSTKRPA